MPSGQITREQHTRNANRTTHDTSTLGDGSGLINCSQTSYANGSVEINSDLVSRKIVTTDNVKTNRANNISDTVGSDSTYTNELNEGAFGSRMRIIGNPDIVHKELHKGADMLKNEIIAARSGFNDDRNTTDFDILSGLSSIPGKIFDAITSVDDDVAEGDDAPLPVGGGNLFFAMAMDVATEIGNYLNKFTKISVSTQLKKAKLVVLNEVEKKKKQIELITKLPESPSKERLKQAILKGDLSVLFANPSNENKEKKSTFDRDEYEAKVAEIVPQLIEIERQCC